MLKSVAMAVSALVFTMSTVEADEAANKQLVRDMVQAVFIARDVSAVDTYFTETYIQRNPMLPSGSDAVKRFLSAPNEPTPTTAQPNVTHRMIAEGDLVATHSTYYNFGKSALVAFDVFRIEDGRIAEHWDNLSPLRDSTNPAGRTQTDGATDISDLDRTQSNKATVIEFVNRMLIGQQKLDITGYINPAKYLQHNLDAGDGLQGLQDLMAANAVNGQTMRYDSVGIVVAEGNFVLTGSAGTVGNQPTAFYDLWRLEDGLIVEHWDVIAPIQTQNLPDGYPGKF